MDTTVKLRSGQDLAFLISKGKWKQRPREVHRCEESFSIWGAAFIAAGNCGDCQFTAGGSAGRMQ